MSYKQKFPISTTDGGLGVTSVTDKSIIVANGTSAVTFITNTATAYPLLSVSGNAPAFSGPVTVPAGGTALTSYSLARTLIFAGTTATGAFQELGSLGNANEVLTSNGAGALPSWQVFSGGGNTYFQKFTSGSTYTPISGMKYCIVECYGGGGAGGGSGPGAYLYTNGGGGGGAGGYCMDTFSAATIGASQTISLGAGGTGSAGTDGGNGGDTTFGSLLTAGGGSGGTFLTTDSGSNGYSVLGGAGGSASGGSVNIAGQNGYPAYLIHTGYATGGKGGSSYWGSGGNHLYTTGAAVNGNNATGYAAGGAGGAKVVNDATTSTGGNGTPGLIYIREYV